MNFRKILWYQPRQDGTRDIKIYAYHDGQKKYFSTGLKVKEEDWNQKSGKVKKVHPFFLAYNARINNLMHRIEEHLLSGGTLGNFEVEENQEKHDLLKFFAQYVEEGDKGLLGLAHSTVKNYRATFRRLEMYEHKQNKKLVFQDVTPEFERELASFLQEYADCSIPGISKHMKILKKVMAVAQFRGLHRNEAYRKYKVHKTKSSNKIYLTKDEVEKLERINLSGQPYLEAERDRFLVAYYFVQRFSDVCAIGRENFFSNDGKKYLRYKSQKTGQEAILPAAQKALDILEKYDYQMGFSTNQQANREMKKICALAGINQVAAEGQRVLPKSQLVTTHTARRSAATNLYLEGASLKTIADLGGWEDIEMLRLYLRASGLDSAKLASDLDFFK